jgi:hypothetical protein
MSASDNDLLESERVKAAAAALLELLPAAIRTRDAAEGAQLAALITLLASGGVKLDQALDAMADAAFVETADDAALEDLAQLVGATPLAPLPPGSGHDLRAYVANTLRNRAGKGTARALEQMAADVGGFGTVVVEYFQRLSRTENLIDVRADRPGVASPRLGVTAGDTGTAFDRLPRLADFRSIARSTGRHHVPNVGVHLLRPLTPRYPAPEGTTVSAQALAGVPRAAPWTNAPGLFRLAGQPDGVVRLFNPDRRSANAGARPTKVALSDRLARLPLHLETQALRRAKAAGVSPDVGEDPWFEGDAPFTVFTSTDGAVFKAVPPAELRIANLETAPAGQPFATADGGPVAAVIDPVTGRIAIPAPVAGPPVTEVRVAYSLGFGRAMGAGPHERNDATTPFEVVDKPGDLHFLRVVDALEPAVAPDGSLPLRTVPSLEAALADWALAIAPAQWKIRRYQRAMFILSRCDREAAGAGFDLPLAPGVEHHVVAAQWRPFVAKPGLPADPGRRGYVVRVERRAILEAALKVSAGSALPDETKGSGALVIDGLELTAGLRVAGGAGKSLRIRHCTVRSPGSAAVNVVGPLAGAAVSLEDAILGPLALSNTGATGSLQLHNCIVSAEGMAAPAIGAGQLDAVLTNVTILGASAFKSLEATNVLFTERVTVQRTQAGCVRYSYVHDCYAPNGSRVPRRFRCLPDLARAAAREKTGAPLGPVEAAAADLSVRPLFLDTALDEPTCAMLHPLASDRLRLGGEGEVEIGALALAAEGVRMANIRRLFDEALPFGLEAGLIDDTRSSAAARRRNVP